MILYRRGWFGDSYRHYLAAKGIKTRYRKRFPWLVKGFSGENPRVTEQYARFRQKDPKEFDKGSFRTVDKRDRKLIIGKVDGKIAVQSVLLKRKRYWVEKDADALWKARQALVRERNEVLAELERAPSQAATNRLRDVTLRLRENADALDIDEGQHAYFVKRGFIDVGQSRRGHLKEASRETAEERGLVEDRPLTEVEIDKLVGAGFGPVMTKGDVDAQLASIEAANERIAGENARLERLEKEAEERDNRWSMTGLAIKGVTGRSLHELLKSRKGVYAARKVLKKGKVHVTKGGEEVVQHAHDVVRQIRPYAKRVEIAGSIRRKKENPVDVDIVVIPRDKERIRQKIIGQATKVYGSGGEKVSARVHGIKTEVVFARPDNWGAQLLYQTGSGPHNIGLRQIAKKRGLLLNQNGVYRGSRLIAGRTERDIYKALGRPRFKQPEERR
jgi:hypothetical protein